MSVSDERFFPFFLYTHLTWNADVQIPGRFSLAVAAWFQD